MIRRTSFGSRITSHCNIRDTTICVILVLFVLGCGLLLFEIFKHSAPRVTTPLGSIEGYYKTSSSGRRFEAYEGIPYARPPIGNFRFRIARPIQPWTGVLMAKQFGSPCVQYNLIPGHEPPGNVTGSEDCLYMNIYTAIADHCRDYHREGMRAQNNLLPVIFFIHGGFFQFGSASLYGPKYLLDKDVTLVTINYRLGPMGFLSTEDEVVPGNMGLKDQVIALRWVQDNIRYFGGDPSRVTIFGHSAGGASVHYHLLSDLTSGLFHRAMSISGTALNCWAQTKGSLEKAKKLATIVGCPSHDVQGMVDCLRIRPANQILRAVEKFLPFLYTPPTPFGPVVEKGGGDFAIIKRPPIEMITSGEAPQDVPWIVTDVSAEGLSPTAQFVTRDRLLDELKRNWEGIAPYLLDFNYTIPKIYHPIVARLIRQHYMGESPIDSSTIHKIIQMVGDRLFVCDSERAALFQAQVNVNPVRFYYFSYRGAHSHSDILSGNNKYLGVSHGDDLAYVLDSFFDPTTTVEDREMQKVMIHLWVSFATNGEPDVVVEWPRLGRSSTAEFHYLYIAGPKEIAVETASNFGQKNFWRTIGFQENLLGTSSFDGDT